MVLAEVERVMLQQVIDAQREALRELSTPLIPISNSAVVMPLVGTIDSGRALQIYGEPAYKVWQAIRPA